jgi:hypothetical protein
MIALLAKKVEFKWTPSCQESFETLKRKLTMTPILILLDVHKPFSVYCDVSYIRLGCVNARGESSGILVPTIEDS